MFSLSSASPLSRPGFGRNERQDGVQLITAQELLGRQHPLDCGAVDPVLRCNHAVEHQLAHEVQMAPKDEQQAVVDDALGGALNDGWRKNVAEGAPRDGAVFAVANCKMRRRAQRKFQQGLRNQRRDRCRARSKTADGMIVGKRDQALKLPPLGRRQ